MYGVPVECPIPLSHFREQQTCGKGLNEHCCTYWLLIWIFLSLLLCCLLVASCACWNWKGSTRPFYLLSKRMVSLKSVSILYLKHLWLTHLKISGLWGRAVVKAAFVFMSAHYFLLPLSELSEPVFVCALTYLDSLLPSQKTITIIFLVMRFSTGTRGYGTRIHVMTWVTPPNSACKYVPDVNDTMSLRLTLFTSLRKYQPCNYIFPLRYGND